MKFHYYEAVDVICSRCHKHLPDRNMRCGDIYYAPGQMSDEDVRWIKTIFNVDPYEEFVLCEECVEGCCGLTGITHLNADTWLKRRIDEWRHKYGNEK